MNTSNLHQHPHLGSNCLDGQSGNWKDLPSNWMLCLSQMERNIPSPSVSTLDPFLENVDAHPVCIVELNRENLPSSILPNRAFDELVQMLHMLWAREQGMARSGLQGPDARSRSIHPQGLVYPVHQPCNPSFSVAWTKSY